MPRPFIQPDDPFMFLEEFALPLTVVQTSIRRPPIQENNFELKSVTLQMLQNILFHGLPNENPNMHLTNFIKVCDMVKYNGVTEEALRLRLFPLSLGDSKTLVDKSATGFYYFMERPSAEVFDKVLPTWKNCTVGARG